MASLEREVDDLRKRRDEQVRARLDQLEQRLVVLHKLMDRGKTDKKRQLESMESVATSSLQEWENC